jgi:hypothetical protein
MEYNSALIGNLWAGSEFIGLDVADDQVNNK